MITTVALVAAFSIPLTAILPPIDGGGTLVASAYAGGNGGGGNGGGGNGGGGNGGGGNGGGGNGGGGNGGGQGDNGQGDNDQGNNDQGDNDQGKTEQTEGMFDDRNMFAGQPVDEMDEMMEDEFEDRVAAGRAAMGLDAFHGSVLSPEEEHAAIAAGWTTPD